MEYKHRALVKGNISKKHSYRPLARPSLYVHKPKLSLLIYTTESLKAAQNTLKYKLSPPSLLGLIPLQLNLPHCFATS